MLKSVCVCQRGLMFLLPLGLHRPSGTLVFYGFQIKMFGFKTDLYQNQLQYSKFNDLILFNKTTNSFI